MYHLPEQYRTIYTIGHSNHSVEDFISMLHRAGVELVADIRSFPGSRKFPHFNKYFLEAYLKLAKIDYIHFPELGAKQRKDKDAEEEAAASTQGFGGYAAYMTTSTFQIAIKQLQYEASKKHTAYMCAEALWWQCHRSMVSDHLKAEGWKVMHIMGPGKLQEHVYPKEESNQGSLF
jgi:uncharacterized protein (DUF488 family)